MENLRRKTSEHESACARVAARFPQRWLRSYVGSKLRSDPVFPAAYELFSGSDNPILDVGCGVGLLAFYLRERGCRKPILGLDVDARKIRQGMAVAQSYAGIDLRCQDVRGAIPDFSGEIALFDALHYLPNAEQRALLSRLVKCVAPGGSIVIRDCPRDQNARFWMTYVAEKFAQAISWNLNTPLHFPSRESINEPFDEIEFERETRSMWGKSPFNNRLFVFRKVGALR